MFEVGKKVICVKSVRNNEGYGVYRGNIYIVDGIKKPCCVGGVLLDVGIIAKTMEYGECSACGHIHKGNIVYISSSHFAPYDDSLSETTVEELLYQLTA